MAWRHITICGVCQRRVCWDTVNIRWVHFAIPAEPHKIDPQSKRVPGRTA